MSLEHFFKWLNDLSRTLTSCWGPCRCWGIAPGCWCRQQRSCPTHYWRPDLKMCAIWWIRTHTEWKETNIHNSMITVGNYCRIDFFSSFFSIKSIRDSPIWTFGPIIIKDITYISILLQQHHWHADNPALDHYHQPCFINIFIALEKADRNGKIWKNFLGFTKKVFFGQSAKREMETQSSEPSHPL